MSNGAPSPIDDQGGAGAAGLMKGRKHIIAFEQAVSLAGSEWLREVLDELALEHDYSDFFHHLLEDELAFEQSTSSPVDRVLSASSALSLIHANTVAGGRIDGGGGGTGIEPIEAIFDSNTAAGHVVYISSDGHVDLALADALATSGVVGVAFEAVVATNTGEYVTEGPITLDDWTNVAGTEFLTPGSLYYLSKDTAGRITTTAPGDGGECVVLIGRATSATSLDIELSPPILLSGATEDEDPTVHTAIFDDSTVVGSMLYIKSDGHAGLADASAEATSGVAGVAIEVVTGGQTGHYITDGPVTRADWTPVLGTEFLTPGSYYYLSLTAGGITGTPVEEIGESIVIVGRALTENVLDLEINPGMLLN